MNKHFSICAYLMNEIMDENGLLDTDLVDLKKYGLKKFGMTKNNLIEMH